MFDSNRNTVYEKNLSITITEAVPKRLRDWCKLKDVIQVTDERGYIHQDVVYLANLQELGVIDAIVTDGFKKHNFDAAVIICNECYPTIRIRTKLQDQLMNAVSRDDIDCIRYLREKLEIYITFDHFHSSYNPLTQAASNGNLSICKYFTAKKNKGYYETDDGYHYIENAINAAARNGHFEVCKYLLEQNEYKINKEFLNDLASTKNESEALKLYELIKDKVNLKNIVNNEASSTVENGYATPLYIALLSKNFKLAKLFVEELGANVNCRVQKFVKKTVVYSQYKSPEFYYYTPLVLAAKSNDIEMCMFLMNYGAKIELSKNDLQKSSFDLPYGYVSILDYLAKTGITNEMMQFISQYQKILSEKENNNNLQPQNFNDQKDQLILEYERNKQLKYEKNQQLEYEKNAQRKMQLEKETKEEEWRTSILDNSNNGTYLFDYDQDFPPLSKSNYKKHR